MQIAAAHIRFEEIPDPRVHGTIGGPESVIVDVEELFEVLLDDLLERIGVAAGPVATSGSRMGHEEGRRHWRPCPELAASREGRVSRSLGERAPDRTSSERRASALCGRGVSRVAHGAPAGKEGVVYGV